MIFALRTWDGDENSLPVPVSDLRLETEVRSSLFVRIYQDKRTGNNYYIQRRIRK